MSEQNSKTGQALATEKLRPLDGITVVSLEHAVAAPFCTRQLADLGARVIKVERPGVGDFARAYDSRVDGLASHFVWLNRSKESLALDLKNVEYMKVLMALLDKANVLVQNLAPGTSARLGLSYEALNLKSPGIIVCDISGYGDSVGDATHPHIVEDVPLALRVTEKLPYDRTSLTQRLGWENRHRWKQTNWDAVKKNSELLRFPMPGWLYDADARQYAYDNAQAVIAHIQIGAPFTNTNVPEGHVHQEWTMSELVALLGSGKPEEVFLPDNTLGQSHKVV